MEFLSRLVGGAPRRPPPRSTTNDPEVRLARFKRLYHTVLNLCNRPRNLATEAPLLEQLHGCLDRIDVIIREETRAPAPHLSLQFAAANKIYTVITRAAPASQHEPIIRATVSVLAALIDSEEEEFLANGTFAKSLMRFVRSIVESQSILINGDTETAILELLFTITAKIRLQPEILSHWFHSTSKPELEDVFVKEKKSFAGITQRDDFPLCYLLMDRVHDDGRIGDFARTGLLYIFEATGRSLDLEEWVVSSDLPTSMATGLGALYSQLSRELSILHPESTLPAVLAMSDYNWTHQRVTAESAFSERHKSHMATFLSYLAFWKDVLDHCRSADVKQTLLDHFQILFLQQLLYPSLLQSSDIDAGSSVAVLTYLTAMIESLEYPDLMNMILEYLLALKGSSSSISDSVQLQTEPPRSPTSVRRRESLLLLAAPKDADDAVEPALFSLVDLVLNNVGSKNSQSVYAALKLSSTIITRQKKFAFGTLLKVRQASQSEISKTVGALELEVDKYVQVATSLHDHFGLDDAYASLADDIRTDIEVQVPFKPPTPNSQDDSRELTGRYVLSSDDPFFRALIYLLRTFFTNSVDVNLALTQAIISIALCIDIRLDNWLAVDPSSYSLAETISDLRRSWQFYLDDEEKESYSALQKTSQRPDWVDENAPLIYKTLQALCRELSFIRSTIPNLDTLISVRKNMLQTTSLDTPLMSSNPPSAVNSPTRTTFLDVPNAPKGKASPSHSRSSSLGRGRSKTSGISSPQSGSPAASPARNWSSEKAGSPAPSLKSLFLPPPPEVPSTTDQLMRSIMFPAIHMEGRKEEENTKRETSLNHVLTNVVVLQEFVLELVAVLQVRAAVLGEKEVRFV